MTIQLPTNGFLFLWGKEEEARGRGGGGNQTSVSDRTGLPPPLCNGSTNHEERFR